MNRKVSSHKNGFGKRRGKVMMSMGALLMAAALFFAGRNLWEEWQGEQAAMKALEQLETVIFQNSESTRESTPGIVDVNGEIMSWPMRMDGIPMPWPTDEAGFPMGEVTDELGNICLWPTTADASEWKRDENGALLPWIGDAADTRMAWLTDSTGKLLSMEEMIEQWNRWIEDVWVNQILPETPTFIRYPDMEMPTERIDGKYYIGVLEVPDKNIRLPIINDWNEQNLKLSPCRYAGSIYKGDMVIAGHNYYRHFSPIKWLEAGTEVRFTDVDGNVFVYEVCDRETIAADDVDGMLTGEWDLTLFTCTTGGRSRVAVRCELKRIVSD